MRDRVGPWVNDSEMLSAYFVVLDNMIDLFQERAPRMRCSPN